MCLEIHSIEVGRMYLYKERSTQALHLGKLRKNQLQSCCVVKVVVAGGPEPWLLVATTEQEYGVLGENPVTLSDPD